MNREEKNIIEAIRYDQFKANAEKKQNAMGYEQAITTLSGIKAGVVEQKFYELLFPNMGISDFVPVRVGENAWTEELVQFMDYVTGGDFEERVCVYVVNQRIRDSSGCRDLDDDP